MRKILIALSALALSATAVTAANEGDQAAIDARRALMQANGAAAAVSAAMMKNELAYNAAVAKSAIATFRAVSLSLGEHFPEGTHSMEGTKASPAIWEKAGDFAAAIAKLQADTAAASQASGKDGPADLAAFQAAVGPVLGDCKSCHEAFRLSN
jgi:cytochrome c556